MWTGLPQHVTGHLRQLSLATRPWLDAVSSSFQDWLVNMSVGPTVC